MSDIQSVKRAFTILTVVAANPNGVNLAKIAEHVELPKSTVSRMLSTLESIEAIERLPYGEGFRIGQATLTLAWQPSYLVTIARPYLLELAQVTGEAVNLCLPDGDQIHYADQAQGKHNVQVRDWTGTRTSFLHTISPGKIVLAHWSAEQLQMYLKHPLERFTHDSITDTNKLGQHLAQIRQQGYAWANEEFEKALVGVSAPVKNISGQLMAVINVSGPAFRFPPEGEQDKVSQLVVNTGQQISQQIRNKF